MEAITLHQYWSHAMARLKVKKIETRNWQRSYRGLLAIHSAKTIPSYARDCFDVSTLAQRLFAPLGIRSGYDLDKLPLGCIEGVCELKAVVSTNRVLPLSLNGVKYEMPPIDSVEYEFGNYEPDRYMWFTEHMITLPRPIPCIGHQSLWTVPGDVEAQVREQMKLAAV